MKKFFFLLTFLYACIVSRAVAQINISQIKAKPFFALDTQHSLVGNKGASTFGIRAGLEFENKFRFGAGYNWLTSDIVEKKVIQEENAIIDTTNAQLTMRYFSMGFSYILYRNDPWEISIPFQLGMGKSYFKYYAQDNSLQKLNEHIVMPVDFGVAGHFKVLKWFGLGFGVGYRFMLVDNPDISTNFNSPTYAVSLKIFIGEIYKSIFPNGAFKENKEIKN